MAAFQWLRRRHDRKREDFYGPYRSPVFEVGCHRYYIRGHSQWVVWLLDSDPQVRELAQWMLGLEAKYDRRGRWWSFSVPPPLFTMHEEEKVEASEPGEVT